jgi:hypothetical protein
LRPYPILCLHFCLAPRLDLRHPHNYNTL